MSIGEVKKMKKNRWRDRVMSNIIRFLPAIRITAAASILRS